MMTAIDGRAAGASTATRLFVFDIGGVFIELDAKARRAILTNGRPDLAEDPAALQALGVANRAFRLGQMAEADYVAVAAAHYGISAEELCRAEFSFLVAGDPQMADLVRRLRQAHRVVGFSNTHALHWRRVSGEILGEDFFDQSYLSHEMGLEKPAPESYQAVIDGEKVDPADIVFVDDTIFNIEAARALGWGHCIHHTDARRTIDEISELLGS